MSECRDASVTIAGRRIGAGESPYVVAELSANHGGEFDRAVELVRAAAASGADAVKLQTYTADTMTMKGEQDHFRISGGTLWDGRTLHDLYSQAATPWEWYAELRDVAVDSGVALFSSPFDLSAVDFLESMGAPAYKIASFEIVDLDLVRHAASTGKPLIISVGMATLAEIEEALAAAHEGGASGVILLWCVSAYPAAVEAMNLRSIPDLMTRFGVPIGLSDHTMAPSAAVAATTLGAVLIEKHLTLSRSIDTADSAFSSEPDEFRAVVEAVKSAHAALGAPTYGPKAEEAASLVFRRSLFVVEDMAAGELFTSRNVRSIRPGYGLAPRVLATVLGRRAACAIKAGTPLAYGLIEGGMEDA